MEAVDEVDCSGSRWKLCRWLVVDDLRDRVAVVHVIDCSCAQRSCR